MKNKTIWKLLFVIACVLFSYTFNMTFYYQWIRGPLAPSKLYTFEWKTLHWLGFAILSYIYGWPMIILAFLDELWQLPLKDRVCDIWDIVKNLQGVGIGLIIRRYFSITIGRRK